MRITKEHIEDFLTSDKGRATLHMMMGLAEKEINQISREKLGYDLTRHLDKTPQETAVTILVAGFSRYHDRQDEILRNIPKPYADD